MPQGSSLVTTVGDISKILTWTKNFVEGETYNIYYEFDAPDVSPYLFTLGALEIGYDSKTFTEARPWYVAVDPTYITESLWSESNSVSTDELALTNSGNANGATTGTWADALGTWAKASYEWWEFVMADSTKTGTINSVTLYLKHYQSGWANDNFLIQIYDGSTWIQVQSYTSGSGPPTEDTTNSWDVKTLGIDTWTEINAAKVRIIGNGKSGQEDTVDWFVDTVELRITYTPTWASYSDSGYTTPCDNFASYADEHTVYMHGSGFTIDTGYKIIYWDANGNNRKDDLKSSDGSGGLDSSHTFASGDQASPPSWHASVYYPQSYSPESYDAGDANLVADDTFDVEDTAIPEFPTVIAAIAVCMLCAVAYMVMRRKVKG